MGIKANFSINDIQKDMEAKVQRIINSAVQALAFLGMKCVNYARSIPDPANGGNGFKDQTGNLRSSIGFKVFQGGRVVKENYKHVLNGTEGVSKGKALADSVGARCGEHQLMLVVTAGMEYAIYVESKGRDVITSSEQLARKEWPNMKQRIDEMIGRMSL